MFRLIISQFAIVGLAFGMFFQYSYAQDPNGIEWQTDFYDAFNIAKSERKPLVVYVFSKDEDGLHYSCAGLEKGALASRELKIFRKDAVFVRVNSTRDDENGNVGRFMRQAKITEVPCVAVAECWDNEIVVRNPFFGDMPTLDFIRLFRNRLFQTILSIRFHGRPACIDAELVRGTDAFLHEYPQLRDEFVVANQARKKLLNQLRYEGVFQVDALKAADQVRSEIVMRMVRRVMSFSELNSPDVLAFCGIQIEMLDDLCCRASLLEEDLIALTVEGRLPGSFAVTMAQITVNASEQQVSQELVKFDFASDYAGSKIDKRFSSLSRQDGSSVVKR